MTDPTTTPEMAEYIGKTYEVDFTRADLEEQFPDHEVFIARVGALAIANFRPDRLRVWIDDDKKVVQMITG